MRILYGVCGEGYGHSSRSKVIIQYLISKGHQVLVITYGQAYPILRHFSSIRVNGLSISFQNNRLSLGKTIIDNASNMLSNLKNWHPIKKKIDAFSPDVCITDMEPLVPIIAYWRNLSLISIDNQHRLTHLPLKVPIQHKKEYLLARAFVNRCVSKANAFIILSFTKEKPSGKKVYLVSPILRKEVMKLRSLGGKHILVYQTKPNNALLKTLKLIPEKFIIYGYNKEKNDANLFFKKTGRGMLKDLSTCKAVIATAGFTLISESLHLKKPYFAVPLQGQFEQTLNALFLNKSGYGTFSENPSLSDLQKFLSNIPQYKKALKSYKSNPEEAIHALDKVLKSL